jgi:hypothetical protein
MRFVEELLGRRSGTTPDIFLPIRRVSEDQFESLRQSR